MKKFIHSSLELSGRSMIEMLGVLAIIGVLSIGGLTAYRQAIMRYHSNEISNFIERIRLAVQDVCPDKTKDCPLFSLSYTQKDRPVMSPHWTRLCERLVAL